MERPGGTWRQPQLPFAAVRRQPARDQSPDFGAVVDPEISEGEVVFPSAQSSQIIVPGTPPTPPESPYRHDSQAAQRQPSTPSPSQPRQLTPEQIAYLQAQEQERFQRQRQAELEQRSFQAGLRSDRAFYQGEFPITRTAPGPNPNQLDYSIPYQTPEYSWQHQMGITQQQQRDIDEQRAAIATAAAEQRQQTRQTRETKQEELDRLADEARQRDRDRRQGGGGSRRNSAITASRRKKIKQSKSKRKSKYTRKSNKNKIQRTKSQRRN